MRIATTLAALLALALPAAAGPAIVVDLADGRVIAQEEPFRPWYPASLTKLMTAYVAFRAIDAGEITLESPIEMTERAAKEPPSKMGYAPGSLLTVQNAIRILMVKSANDVATAIAENIGGSVSRFATRMNTEAARLGMTNTRFVNAHGLHSDEQYTTARDMALLAVAIRREYPQYASYFGLEALRDGETLMANHNDLIGRFTGADGMKTGYTCPSGFNLVASATRGGRSLIAVVLGEPSPEARADKAADMLAAAFGNSDTTLPAVNALLQPSQTMSEPTNMRSAICTEDAYKARMEARGESGKPAYRSPHIQAIEFTPRETVVGLGGTRGPVLPRVANVPVPTPRPDYTPDASDATAAVSETGDDG
jgi:D-alanyl-D-alanine carboxypeptidase